VTTKLVGADDATGVNSAANYFFLNRFQAEASGNMTEFRLKSGAAGNVKCALYADNSGEPGALITAMNTGQAVTGSGWETLSFTSTPITSGTYYWLALIFSTSGVNQRHESSGMGTRRVKSETYDTFTFPDPAGEGFSGDAWLQLIAGWGDVVTAKTSSDTGSGADAYVSLETPGAKLSSDIGSGLEGTPLPGASLAGSETGAGIEALAARLLASLDTGSGVEVAQLVGLLKDLFATELGEGGDLLTAKIEMPTKGGGMKLWT
jgi:hypothetical protein